MVVRVAHELVLELDGLVVVELDIHGHHGPIVVAGDDLFADVYDADIHGLVCELSGGGRVEQLGLESLVGEVVGDSDAGEGELLGAEVAEDEGQGEVVGDGRGEFVAVRVLEVLLEVVVVEVVVEVEVGQIPEHGAVLVGAAEVDLEDGEVGGGAGLRREGVGVEVALERVAEDQQRRVVLGEVVHHGADLDLERRY